MRISYFKNKGSFNYISYIRPRITVEQLIDEQMPGRKATDFIVRRRGEQLERDDVLESGDGVFILHKTIYNLVLYTSVLYLVLCGICCGAMVGIISLNWESWDTTNKTLPSLQELWLFCLIGGFVGIPLGVIRGLIIRNRYQNLFIPPNGSCVLFTGSFWTILGQILLYGYAFFCAIVGFIETFAQESGTINRFMAACLQSVVYLFLAGILMFYVILSCSPVIVLGMLMIIPFGVVGKGWGGFWGISFLGFLIFGLMGFYFGFWLSLVGPLQPFDAITLKVTSNFVVFLFIKKLAIGLSNDFTGWLSLGLFFAFIGGSLTILTYNEDED